MRHLSTALIAAIIALGSGCSNAADQVHTPVVPVPGAQNARSVGIQADIQSLSIEKTLGTASPRFFEVLGLGSPTNVSITGPSRVSGPHDVGVAGASQFSMSDGVIDGRLVLTSQDTKNISGPAKIKGGIVIDDARLAGATTDALNASATFAGLPASPNTPTNINITNPNGDMTITATSAVTVVDLGDLVLNGASTVTLSAPDPQWQFIINITGKLVLQGGSKVIVSGINPPHVVFNVVGQGQDVAMGGGTHNGVPTSELDGVVLAPQRNVALSPGLVRPEVIGGGKQLVITSGGRVFNHDQ